jgi:hypothetical protein
MMKSDRRERVLRQGGPIFIGPERHCPFPPGRLWVDTLRQRIARFENVVLEVPELTVKRIGARLRLNQNNRSACLREFSVIVTGNHSDLPD